MGDEIKAMGAINTAMEGLEPDEVNRVLRWAVDKFGGGQLSGPSGEPGTDGGRGTGSAGNAPAHHERISDLMDAASPSSGADYVLVASYWFQVLQGQADFTAQEVNSELKDLGHASRNITDSFNTLKSRKPAAVRQVQKGGTTKQARKRYRLTTEGIKTVERMIRGESEE